MRLDLVLIRPVVTEKTVANEGVYTFVVDARASKHDVAKAVESFYQVEVEKVNTQNMPAKFRMGRGGKPTQKKAEYKKALVRLKEGAVLEFNSMK